MIKNYKSTLMGAVCAAFSLSFAASAQAALVEGADVWFDYDDTTQFGVGTVIGNAIYFAPTDFSAQSTNGSPGGVINTETLNIRVYVKEGSDFVIDGGHLVENGDYFLQGGGSSVTAGGRFWARSNTNGLSTEEFFSAGTLDTQNAFTPWSAEATLDFDDVAGWGEDTDVLFQLQNNLIANTAENGELALIQKKDGSIGIEVMPEIPLPGTVWLFGSALLGLAGFRSQKSK